jgi:hypothetical protein
MRATFAAWDDYRFASRLSTNDSWRGLFASRIETVFMPIGSYK